MNNFGKRAISGFLFVVILTACIYIHPFCFFALFFIINIIGLLEFSHMAEVIHIRVTVPCVSSAGACFSFQGSFITISVIKKVICFSSVPHSYGDLGIVPEEYPCFSEYGFRDLCSVLFHPALYFADLPPLLVYGQVATGYYLLSFLIGMVQ